MALVKTVLCVCITKHPVQKQNRDFVQEPEKVIYVITEKDQGSGALNVLCGVAESLSSRLGLDVQIFTQHIYLIHVFVLGSLVKTRP